MCHMCCWCIITGIDILSLFVFCCTHCIPVEISSCRAPIIMYCCNCTGIHSVCWYDWCILYCVWWEALKLFLISNMVLCESHSPIARNSYENVRRSFCCSHLYLFIANFINHCHLVLLWDTVQRRECQISVSFRFSLLLHEFALCMPYVLWQ